MKKAIVTIVILTACVASFFGGLYFAEQHIVFGNIDVVAGKPDQAVRLTKDVTFRNEKGEEVTLNAGRVLAWEGAHGHQHYMSIRYIINDGSVFETLDGSTSQEFIQKD